VQADEVTYNLHVLLRFELEQALLSGSLPVVDVPSAWNEGMQRLLGLTPANDADGCLQDIHWSAGLFGANAEEWEKRNESFFAAADKVNGTVKRLDICVGDQDSLAASGSRALAGVFEKRGVRHDLHVSSGGHTWINWRHYLAEMAPKLFR